MSITLHATCSNGNLILDRQLSADLEGKTLQIIILESEDRPNVADKLDAPTKLEQFLEHAKQYSFKFPTDYTFNREELYDR
jgi:hypothetical protein